MRTCIFSSLFVAGLILSGSLPLTADTPLDDHFDDGVLGTNTLGTGGGFISTDNGFTPAGSVTESGSLARIVEGGGSNRHGIESINAFDLSDDTLVHTITWQIAAWPTTGNSGERRIGLEAKSYSSSSATPADSSLVTLSVDEKNNHISFTYQNRTGGVVTNHAATNFDLDAGFTGDPDGFALTLVLDLRGFSISTSGLNNSTEANFSETWSSLSNGGTDFTTALGTDGPMFIAASLQNQSMTGATVDIDQITVTREPPITTLDDHFDDGVLGTDTFGVAGGFIVTDNANTPVGSASESDSQAKIVEGGNSNRQGIQSINSFDLSDDGLGHSITWHVASWGAQGNSGERRIGLNAKSYSDALATPADSSLVTISVDAKNDHISFTYQNRTGGVVTNHAATSFDLDGSFSGDPDGFSLTLTLDVTGFRITTIGLNNSSQANYSGTWASLSNGGTDFVTALGTDGPMFIDTSIQNQNFTGATLDIDRITLIQAVPPVLEATLGWNAIDANAAESLYFEKNWIDPVTGETPSSANTIAPNIGVNRSLVIRTGTVGGSGGAPGDLLMGLGDLTLTTATLRMQDGASIDLGIGSQDVTMVDSKIFAESLINADVEMDGYSELTLGGSAPLDGSTVNLLSSNCFVHLLDVIPGSVGPHLSKIKVDGVAANSGGNVIVTQYYNGCAIRPKLPNNHVMKGFDGPDLTGTSWNFGTGFKGPVGAGLIAYNDGTYNVESWGADIWGTEDQCRFTYNDMTGDAEVIAKVTWVQDTHTWAKSGVMMRSDLSADSPNAFVLQNPGKQVAFQVRTAQGGSTSIEIADSGVGNTKWLRLVRSGNDFTAYYNQTSASGPWIQIGDPVTINMGATVKAGIAATSHLGLARGNTNFKEVSTVPASPLSNFGIFDESVDIESAWWIDNQMSSFLLKKGYMVTVSTEGGGQGESRVYVASEGDLKVNLPASLDNQISFMRVLPWRWVAKRGWCGGNASHMSLIQAYWSYQWEPTGSSTINREFVPMIKGRGQNKDSRWLEVRARANQTHFLVFNEPEAANQGDLTVDEAIALWPKALQSGLRLVSPGRTDGNNGNNWLSSFMAKADAKGYRVDAVSVHNYNRKTASQLKTWLTAEYNKYKKPIWLTEFQRENDDNPSAATHEAYLAGVIPMLEDLWFVERYSYFTFNTGGVTSATASLFNNGPVLNAKGDIYRNVVSQPAYRNTGQPDWATASLDLASGGIIQASDGGVITASSSIDSSKISKVEFFVNGISVGTDSSSPHQLSVDALGYGMQSIHSVVTTNFGEKVTSPASQVFVTDFGLLDPSPGPAGEISWFAIPGETYEYQTTTDLLNPVWNVLETRVATGFVETASDPAWATETKRFYRIHW
ncbi:glycosyl hydrolase [Haloferula sp.]|uniref:glycosyl hydrolase n=1 Tax=Haloferula sp. TaxID=2497595 RepID=UPI00329E045D